VAHALTWLDVFTATPLTGNGLAVVHDADDLDDATMLAFARETRLSETTFVQTATAEGADYRNRIFMVGRELDFAGHPSLGTAVAVARARGETEVRYVQQTPAGLQPIEVELGDGTSASAAMLQGPATFGDEVDPAEALAAAGLDPSEAHPELAPQVVSTGQPHLMAAVRDASVLERARPNTAGLRDLMPRIGCTVLYLAAFDEATGIAHARGFFLQPDGATEDPATGSAAGPLCAYLHARTGVSAVVIHQGVAMGRPSRLDTAIEGDLVRVGGDVVVVSTGTLLV
jgi:trans-2,3-dihydro-3-hydroxyanthranilate isomerase